MLVVMTGMCPDKVLVASLIELTITGDIVMIAGEPETGIMVGNEPLHGIRPITTSGGTMNDNEFDRTHLLN